MEHSISKIKIFTTIVERGSIKSASAQLNLDSSTVSRQLSSLENDLGLLLVRRSTRKLSVTAIGKQIFKYYKTVTEELKKVEKLCNMTDLPRDIHLTIPQIFGSYAVMPLIQDYIEQHPHIRIHVDWSDLRRDLVESNFDIGIRGEKLDSENIVALALSELKLCFIASPKLLKRYHPVKSFVDLVKLPWIRINFQNRPCSKLPPLKKGFHLNVNDITEVPLTVNSQEAAIKAVQSGIGITIVERVAVEAQIEQSKLLELFPDSIESLGYYWLYKPDGRWIQPHIREFSQHLIDKLRVAHMV